MNKKIVHDALILFAFTLVLGLILAFVYSITKDPIDAANQATKEAAYKAVFEDAYAFEAYEGYDKASANAVVSDGGYSKDTIDDVQVAYDSAKNVLGYVITVTAKDGSQGSITFSVGIQTDGTVNGYSITSTGETPGLGLKASEEEFYSQFENQQTSGFYVNDKETGSEGEVGIDAITGSTITSKAIVHGCNAAILYFNSIGGEQ